MKRSITRVGLTLGTAALLAYSAGCSKKPAQQPSPTFESSMGQPAGEPGAAPMGTTGAPTAPTATTPMTPPAQLPEQQAPQGYPHDGAQQGQQGPGAQPQMNEKETCDTLKSDSRITVEDVQGGVNLIIKPRQSASMMSVRDQVHAIEHQISAGGQRPPAAEQCALYDLGHALGVTVTVTESADSIRLMMTTTDPTQVKNLRRQARDFVAAAPKPRK